MATSAVSVADRTGSRAGILPVIAAATSDIKIAHTVFAMPFALLASFMARDEAAPWSVFAGQASIVVICMICARTWAMLVNRIADRHIDALNPRTERRAIPSGRLRVRQARIVAVACAVLFVGAASLFWVFFRNPWPVTLSIPVLAWIAMYSFMKRFSALCHVFLGTALAISPLAAALAIRPESLGDTPALWWVAAMIVLWVAGFDVIYALQDVDVDRRDGLHSIPAALGRRGAAYVSRVLHVGAFVALVMAWRVDPRFGVIFGCAAVMVGGILVLEHVILARRGNAGLQMAFFTLNGVVSCALGAAGIVDWVS